MFRLSPIYRELLFGAFCGEEGRWSAFFVSCRGFQPSQASRRRVPEPPTFSGIRNVKELKNFIRDVEQYFQAAHIPPDEQVQICTAYLTGGAKL